MIDVSCNLIGRKQILVDNLKLDVINEKKDTVVSLELN